MFFVYAQAIVFHTVTITTERLFANWHIVFSSIYYNRATVFYYLAATGWLIIVFLGFFELWKIYKKSRGFKRVQTIYLISGFFIGFIGGFLCLLPAIGINFYPCTSSSGALYAIIITYAILRHQLMDITIVIRKTAIYSIVATIITIAYFILIYVVEGLFRGFMGYKSVPWTLSVIAIFTLIFQPLKNMVQLFIDKYFFKGSQALLQEELKKAQEELRRIERLKAVGTIAAGMAHEIKNPLTGIKTFTEYLPSKGSDPEFRDKFYKIVTAEVSKINGIVQQLLDFSKPKPLQLKQCNIHSLLDQTLAFLNNDFIKYRINLIKNYDPAFPLLSIDQNQMQQVFLNLFLNAIDSMKQSGSLTITTKLQSDVAKITIKDTGTGISKKDLERIFDPFYTTKETGTGLGMSIVYGIIKEHNGEITVESEVGKGTIFKIKLQTT